MEYDIHDMNVLFERYLNGETTVDEQKMIQKYLVSEDIPEEFLPYKEMFEILSFPQEVPSDEELKAFAVENGLEMIEDVSSKKDKRVGIFPLFKFIGVVAASVILFVGGYFIKGDKPAEIKEVEKEKLVEVVRTQRDTVTVMVEKIVYRNMNDTRKTQDEKRYMNVAETDESVMFSENQQALEPEASCVQMMNEKFRECELSMKKLELYKN